MTVISDFIEGFYDGPHATPKEASEGPIFLGIKNVTPEGRLDFSQIRHVSDDEFAKWTKRVTPQKDDIVFTYEATLHRYALIPEGFHGCLGRRMALMRPDTSKVYPRFLHYYCLSSAWRAEAEASVLSGATVDRIPLTKVPSFKVNFPDLTTQERIAAILSAYDDLIENNRRRIALLERAARLLYREWFVHFRFPGHETAKFVDGLPEEWEIKQVKDLLLRLKAKPKIRKDEYEQKGLYPCVDQGQSFVGGYTDKHEAIYRDELPLIVFGDHTRSLKYVDFPFARGADGTQIIHSNNDRLSQPQFYFALINVDLSNYAYARHFKFLKDQEIIVPDEAIGLKFTEIVEKSFAQIKNLRGQIEQLTAARDLLLPRLMDGRIPV